MAMKVGMFLKSSSTTITNRNPISFGAQNRSLKLIAPKSKQAITPQILKNPPKTFLSLNFIRRLPTDEIILDEKTLQTLKALPEHDKPLFKELKEKEAVLKLKAPYDITVYDPTPPKQTKYPPKMTFDLIWQRIAFREIYYHTSAPRLSYWRMLCDQAKTVEEWKKVKLFWNIWERKGEEISKENQITFTKAAIRTGNLDFILSRVVEPAFRFKPASGVVTILLKEITKKEDYGKPVYWSIDQALRKLDNVDTKTILLLFKGYFKVQADDKAFGLWFYADKFPDMLPEIAVHLIKASLIEGDIDAAKIAAESIKDKDFASKVQYFTSLNIINGDSSVDYILTNSKLNVTKDIERAIKFVSSLKLTADNTNVQSTLKNFVENLKEKNVELPDLSSVPFLN